MLLSSFYKAMCLVADTDGEFSYKFSEGEYETFFNLVQVLCYPMDKNWYKHEKQPLMIYIDPEEIKIIKN